MSERRSRCVSKVQINSEIAMRRWCRITPVDRQVGRRRDPDRAYTIHDPYVDIFASKAAVSHDERGHLLIPGPDGEPLCSASVDEEIATASIREYLKTDIGGPELRGVGIIGTGRGNSACDVLRDIGRGIVVRFRRAEAANASSQVEIDMHAIAALLQ